MVTDTASAFRPFVPRLAATWQRDRSGEVGRVIDASLLGLDISGFTALSERLAERGKLGAEELIMLISGCYSGLIEIGKRYGGDVLKFRGDALLLLFDGDRHEDRAARAALAMQVFVAESGSGESSVGPVRLGMAAGVVSAPCHFFLVGRVHRELIVCGPAASATLGLEDAAESGEVLVSARTAEALEGLVAVERDGSFLLRSDAAAAELPSLPDELDGLGDLSALLPPTLRGPIAMGAIEAEHRQATAAFVKFSGTDQLVEAPDEAAAALAALADVVSSETDDLGITWLESDIDHNGGKLYLVAGAPSSAGDDEDRMLRAARAIVDAGVGPAIGVGVNRGPVLAGPIGSPSRTTYAVMGDTVNLAARLAARAAKGEILATGDVLQRARTRFDTTSRQFLMKGKAKPVTGHAVGAVSTETVEETRPLLPLVGREHELASLAGAVDAARLRQSRAVEIVGEPGAGKSRLVEELGSISVGFQFLRGRCEPYSASTPFGPFREMLRPLIGALPDESRESAGAKLTTFAQTVMPDLAQWLPLLALPFDAEVPDTEEVDQIDSVFRRDRLHDVLDQFLARMLLMPTVLLVEDVHWLDDASQLLLAKLAQPAPRPWLVVATRRPSGLPLAAADVLVLELEPLGVAEARALALAASGDLALSEEQLAAVTVRAAGNPLFIRELAVAPADDDALPETVESLLTIRIDTLEANDRLLLRHASVIGPTFDLDLLAEILPDEATDPEQWVRLADFVDWVGPGAAAFPTRPRPHRRLRRSLVCASARDSRGRRRRDRAPVGRRSRRPRMSCRCTSSKPAGSTRPGPTPSAAGDDARSKYANIDAATFYERALAASGHFDPASEDVARVCEALGDVRELAARYDDADAAYGRALEHGAALRGCCESGVSMSERHGRYDEALELYELAPADADAAETVALELARAIVLYRQGKDRRVRDQPRARRRRCDRARRPGDARGRVLRPSRGRRRSWRPGPRVPRPRARDLRRARACCTDRRPCSTTWASAPTTKAPGTTRSSCTTAPRRSSGGRATCSPAGTRRTTGPRSCSTRGASTRRRSCSTSRCAPTAREVPGRRGARHDQSRPPGRRGGPVRRTRTGTWTRRARSSRRSVRRAS